MLKKALFGTTLALSLPLHADFLTALQAFERKDYLVAEREFTALLPLANEQAAFNLAAMALHGQGGTVNPVKAAAYLQLAADWGHDEATTALHGVLQQLDPAQTTEATQLARQLKEATLIGKDLKEPDYPAAALSVQRRVEPQYPVAAARNGQFGYVTLQYLVNENGDVIAVDTLDSFPEHVFEKTSVTALKRWKFNPSGQKQLGQVKLTYSLGELKPAALQTWLKTNQVWSFAATGSPRHQEALGSLLHLISNNSGIELQTDNSKAFDAEKLPEILFSFRKFSSRLELKDFNGSAKVRTDQEGNITQVLAFTPDPHHQMTQPQAEKILLGQHISKATAGDYQLTAQLTGRTLVRPIQAIHPFYHDQFWWEQAAKNGDLRAQRVMAASAPDWQAWLLRQNDPQVQTWQGVKLILSGNTATGTALLRQAKAQDYPVAKQLADVFL